MVTRQQQMLRNRNISSHTAATKVMGPVSMTIILTIIVGVMALLYLTQITKTTVFGYRVSNLTQERQALQTENQELQIEAARLQSVASIQSSQAAKQLQPQNQVSFVSGAGDTN